MELLETGGEMPPCDLAPQGSGTRMRASLSGGVLVRSVVRVRLVRLPGSFVRAVEGRSLGHGRNEARRLTPKRHHPRAPVGLEAEADFTAVHAVRSFQT